MIARLVAIAACLLLPFAAQAQTPKTKAQLQSEITSSLSNNITGAITPGIMRNLLSDIVNGYTTALLPNGEIFLGNSSGIAVPAILSTIPINVSSYAACDGSIKTGNITSGSAIVTGISTTGIKVGQYVGGGAYFKVGDTTNTSTTITNVADTSRLFIGMGISGTGIPAGTTITAVNAAAFTLTISQAATASNAVVTFTIDTGIPDNTTVTTFGGNQITLSNNATRSVTGISLTIGTDDTVALENVALAANAAISSQIEFPANAICIAYPTIQSTTDHLVVMPFANISNTTLNFNGAQIRTLVTNATAGRNLLQLSAATNVVINGYNVVIELGKGTGASIPPNHIDLTEGTSFVWLNGMQAEGGTIGIRGVRTPGSPVARSHDVNMTGSFKSVFYPINGQFDIDNVTATYTTNNAGRSVFMYGVQNWNVDIASTNPSDNDVLIEAIPNSSGENSTTGIYVKYTNKNSFRIGAAIYVGMRQFDATTRVGYVQATVDLDVIMPSGENSNLIGMDSWSALNVLGDSGSVLDLTIRGTARGGTSQSDFAHIALPAGGFGPLSNVKTLIQHLHAPDTTGAMDLGVGTRTSTTLVDVHMPNGSLTYDGSTSVAQSVATFNSEFSNTNSSLLSSDTGPARDAFFDLGGSGNRWNNVYAKGIVGTTTNDNAPTGDVGEFISSEVLAGAAVSVTDSTATDVTSILLTPGDWSVTGNVVSLPAGSTTQQRQVSWAHTVSATLPTPPNKGAFVDVSIVTAAGNPSTTTIGTLQVKVATGTTQRVYLGTFMAFSVSTMKAYGFIGARRVR